MYNMKLPSLKSEILLGDFSDLVFILPVIYLIEIILRNNMMKI